MARMTDDDLKSLVNNEVRVSLGYEGGLLAMQRRKAMIYYLGQAKDDLAPPEVDGRSAVVSTDVRNTIEAMMPQLMATFTGGDKVVEFEETEEGDEEKAKLSTEYLNYLFFKKNDGRRRSYVWMKDALLSKRGFLKVWWDTRAEETREEYEGQTPVNLAMLMDDPEIEITEQKSYPDEDDAKQRADALEKLQQQYDQALEAAQQGNQQAAQAIPQIQAQIQGITSLPPAMLYDVTCKRKKTGGKLQIENVPPEELLVSRRIRMDLQTSPSVSHRFLRTISELKSMGYKNVDDIGGDSSDMDTNMERVEREGWDDEMATAGIADDTTDPSQRQVWVVESYIRVDFDGDGIAELRKVTIAGNSLLDNEVVDEIPFVSICPIPVPHLFFGMSEADLSMEWQRVNTALMRAGLDNVHLEVNGRYFAVENQVNLDDLLSSRPGGVVRVKNAQAVGRLDQGKGSLGETMQMMEVTKSALEDSTGWSRNSQGNDPDALHDGETATKTRIVTNKADMRTELVAVQFAEGYVDLFKMMLGLVCKHQKKPARIKIKEGWVGMDPREWRNQFDVTINVGLGMGNKDEKIQRLMALRQDQGHSLALGIATPMNMYESAIEMTKYMGFKNGEKFYTKPDPNKPLPNPGAAEAKAKMDMHGMELQAKGQMQQAQMQFDAQIKQMEMQQEAQLEQMRAQMQAEVDNNRQRSEAEQQTLKIQQEAQLDALKAQHEQERHMREMDFKRWAAELDASVRIEVANIGSKAKVENAATETATNEIAREVQQ